jgi:chaperonin GroES
MSKPKVKPLGNHVLIQRSKAPATKGGILLPDSAQEKPREGQVLAVGPGKYSDDGRLDALNVKVGDRVLFSNYAGTEVKNTDQDSSQEEYLIIKEDDILGIIA